MMTNEDRIKSLEHEVDAIRDRLDKERSQYRADITRLIERISAMELFNFWQQTTNGQARPKGAVAAKREADLLSMIEGDQT